MSMAKSLNANLKSYLRKDEKLLLSIAEVCDPQYTALIIVDMQNDFVYGRGQSTPKRGEPLTPPQEIIPDLREFVEFCRLVGVPIFWIVTHHAGDIDFPAYKALIARRAALPVCVEGTKGTEIIKELVPGKEERLFVKHGYDAFTGTDLDVCLKNRNIRTLIMSGVGTGTCVAATLIHGFHLGFYIVVSPELTATVTYGRKELFFDGFQQHYALIASSKEIAAMWNKP